VVIAECRKRRDGLTGNGKTSRMSNVVQVIFIAYPSTAGNVHIWSPDHLAEASAQEKDADFFLFLTSRSYI
jgi:hypothetical protein